jgi:hypothetical protein
MRILGVTRRSFDMFGLFSSPGHHVGTVRDGSGRRGHARSGAVEGA